MALDRFVYWGKKKPTRAEIEGVLRGYLEGAAISIEWKRDRFFVQLVGQGSFAFRYIGHPNTEREMLWHAPPHDGRYIEVWADRECLDVITRHADEYTNTVAEGIAKLFARYWDGKLEE